MAPLPSAPVLRRNGREVLTNERVVAVGFLTQHDLTVLGRGFQRYMPIEHDDVFGDLLAKLDEVEASPFGKGMTIMPKAKH